MKGQILSLPAILVVLALSTPSAFGQHGGFSRGGFSAEGMFDMLDRDRSGVIDPEEIEQSPMSRFVDRMGIDTSRGITREDFSASMDRVRKSMEEGGGFRGMSSRSGSGGHSGRGDSEGDRHDDGRSRWRSRWGGGDDGGSSRDRFSRSRDVSRSHSLTVRTSPAKAEPPPRVTVDLQQEFIAGDADQDGQIGLYEWTRWKSRAALGQFLGLDRDHDGFLTPRELAHADEAQPVDITSVYPSTSVIVSPRTAESEKSTLPLVSPEDVQEVIAAADNPHVKKAMGYFSLLDRDRDGSISELEWIVSKRLKPRFEEAGADLAQPMSSDLFVSYYVRIFAADESS